MKGGEAGSEAGGVDGCGALRLICGDQKSAAY